MRAIRKGREPDSLVQHRLTPSADYDGYREKQTLRACLVREQRGLCCYCPSRIRAEWDAMKIEHWHSRRHHGAEQLEYSNLLGACMGNQGASPKFQHCDTRKEDRDLSRNLADPDHRIEEFIRFLGDGRIVSTDPAFETELNDVLNLNSRSSEGIAGRRSMVLWKDWASKPVHELRENWKRNSASGTANWAMANLNRFVR